MAERSEAKSSHREVSLLSVIFSGIKEGDQMITLPAGVNPKILATCFPTFAKRRCSFFLQLDQFRWIDEGLSLLLTLSHSFLDNLPKNKTGNRNALYRDATAASAGSRFQATEHLLGGDLEPATSWLQVLRYRVDACSKVHQGIIHLTIKIANKLVDQPK